MPDILECRSVSNKSTVSANNVSPLRKSKSDIKDLYRDLGLKSGFSQKTPCAESHMVSASAS